METEDGEMGGDQVNWTTTRELTGVVSTGSVPLPENLSAEEGLSRGWPPPRGFMPWSCPKATETVGQDTPKAYSP